VTVVLFSSNSCHHWTVVAWLELSAALVSVSLPVYPHDVSKTDWIAELDTEMSHHESWKYIYFGVKRPTVNATRHKNIAGVVHGALCECRLFLVNVALTFLISCQRKPGKRAVAKPSSIDALYR